MLEGDEAPTSTPEASGSARTTPEASGSACTAPDAGDEALEYVRRVEHGRGRGGAPGVNGSWFGVPWWFIIDHMSVEEIMVEGRE